MLAWLIVNDARAVWVTALSVVMFLGSTIIIVAAIPPCFRPPPTTIRPMSKDSHESPKPRSRVSAAAVRLVVPTRADLEALYQIQLDPEANAMAGTRPRSRADFDALWERTLTDAAGGSARLIHIDTEIVGSIARFQAEGNDCVGYWIARAHWGRGIASHALHIFLQQEPVRPLHATAAAANAASRRILEKSGFSFLGLRMGEATERFIACEIADYVIK